MTDAARLRLPTPGPCTPPPSSVEDQPTDAAYLSSRAFSFPFPRAYSIQLTLMQHIFRAIEDGQVGVFESPTGTGKSLSLICSAFTWLRQNQDRAIKGELDRIQASAEGEPEWVVEHRRRKVRAEMVARQDELRARIRRARELQKEWKRKAKSKDMAGEEHGWARKRARREEEEAWNSDDDFLASDVEDDVAAPAGGRTGSRRSYALLGARIRSKAEEDDDYANLSPEVRALMAQLDGNTKPRGGFNNNGDDDEPETLPRIVYASRTHSQLSQFVAELRKTDFGKRIKITSHWSEDRHSDANATSSATVVGKDEEAEAIDPIRTISLGSRKQMCIHPEVQRLGERAAAEAMNERCLELLKGSTAASKSDGRKRCGFLPPQDERGRAQMLEFRDHAMAEVTDIEDLVQLGKEMKVCPYFAARNSARQAELITLPYNLLLQKDARQSLGISFKGCVVLIDEAHNLIDNILSTHTVIITSEQVEQAAQQIQTYLDRFALRLKGSSEAHLRQLTGVLGGLRSFCTKWTARQQQARPAGHEQQQRGFTVSEEIMSASQLVAEIGGTLDRINLVELEWWMKETQIARKVSGYADKQAQRKRQEAINAALEAAAGKNGKRRTTAKAADGVVQAFSHAAVDQGPSPIAAMHAIESFILSLANRTEDGRVLLSLEHRRATTAVAAAAAGTGMERDEGATMKLKYQLLNPSHVFQSLLDEARSVILAGGTMEPISDFRHQLVPSLPAQRFTSHSCGHIIPPSNLCVTVLASGPRGVPFEFKYDNRNDPALLDELGNALVNLCNLIPDGLVVFLPSYAFLDNVVQRWRTNVMGAQAQKQTLWQRIEAKKRIFLEPATTREVDKVLREYTLEIDAPKQSKVGGAILFAVVGAKLSEGINFSDQLARGVVMVGMPFPNARSPELAERMRYVRELAARNNGQQRGGGSDAGKELYTNLCMKAVNQSIGRAIRHRDDYASLVLLDGRYGRADIRARLPQWIAKEVVVAEGFGKVAQRIGGFFRAKSGEPGLGMGEKRGAWSGGCGELV